MEEKVLNNISFFSNTGIGEYGTQNINIESKNGSHTKIKTVIANELLKERAEIYKLNYDACMITGSITDQVVMETLIEKSHSVENKPVIATVSPPCQASSGLNAFKDNPKDYRNQLIKSFFYYLENYNNIQYGYIENVTSYYSSSIPGLLNKKIFWHYIKNEKEEMLNYPYFLLFNKETEQYYKDFIKEHHNKVLEKGMLGEKIEQDSVSYSYFIALNDIKEFNLSELHPEIGCVSPINLKEYIEQALSILGYNAELDWVRGDEYGAPQIRQRGFFIFYKKELNNMTFPKPIFNTIKSHNYNGKTILDALLSNNLIEVYEQQPENMQDIIEYNGLYYKDSAISKKQFDELVKKKVDTGNYLFINQSEMHFKKELSDRYNSWVSNTPEGQSSYFNDKRHHRPYKIIKVSKEAVKSDNQFVVKEADQDDWMINNGVIDYKWFLTSDITTIEKDFTGEKSKKIRHWQINNTANKKKLTNKMICFAQALIKKDFEHYLNLYYEEEIIKDLRLLFQSLEKHDFESFYLFLPIKGFEQATYKRASLSRPSSALTTKMNIGNSNTLHPVFNRTWTPQEVMVLFGLGFVIENNEYKKIEDYKLPINSKTNSTRIANIVYEICGEGIISTVAQEFLKQLTQQYLSNK